MLPCSYQCGKSHLQLILNPTPSFVSKPQVECGWGKSLSSRTRRAFSRHFPTTLSSTLTLAIGQQKQPCLTCALVLIFSIAKRHNHKQKLFLFYHNLSNQMIFMCVDKLHFSFAAKAILLLLL